MQAQALFEQGKALEAAGNKAAALQCYNQAVQAQPDFSDACAALARVLEESGQLLMALQVYAHLQAVAPGHGALSRAVALRASAAATQLVEQLFAQSAALVGQQQYALAEGMLRQALAVRADLPELWCNLSVALLKQRKLAQAVAAAQQALALSPGMAVALNAMGSAHKDMGDYDGALAAFRQAIKAQPDYFEALVNLGKCLQEREEHGAAIEAFEKALKLQPENAEVVSELVHRLQHVCRWEEAARHAEKLEALAKGEGAAAVPFMAALYCSPQAQLANARRWAQQRFGAARAWEPKPLPADARGDGKLRIGYVSADFHAHATAYLVSELFERHDRARFEVVAYSNGVMDGSAEQARIMGAVDAFRDIRGLDDTAAAQLVMQDGIDILVDMKGYTFGHRLGMMQHRPAPVQAHYLGYPGTTGAVFMDYFIGDAVCCEAAHFSEAVVKLPGCYQMNDGKRPLPTGALSRAECGLPEEGFVFCNFNQLYKITPQMFGLWLEILERVEGSVLWLYESVPGGLDVLKKRAGALASRIHGAGKVPLLQHVQRYGLADAVLDSYPVCGHTTSSDALWCGVPVVALMGDSFASRVSGSLLAAVGLAELAVRTPQEYVKLACDTAKLKAAKQALISGRGAHRLFDAAATTRALEAAYEQMAARQRAGLAPGI